MKRFLVPRGCSGACMQGQLPCDCELSNAIAPDADRVIAPPAPLNDDVRSRILRRALVLAALAFAALGALVGISDPRFAP